MGTLYSSQGTPTASRRVMLLSGAVTLIGLNITGGYVDGNGGGAGAMVVAGYDCWDYRHRMPHQSNVATWGGGVYVAEDGEAVLHGCSTSNTATNSGGGIFHGVVARWRSPSLIGNAASDALAVLICSSVLSVNLRDVNLRARVIPSSIPAAEVRLIGTAGLPSTGPRAWRDLGLAAPTVTCHGDFAGCHPSCPHLARLGPAGDGGATQHLRSVGCQQCPSGAVTQI